MGDRLYGMKELSDISLGRHLKEVQGTSLSFCCSLDHALTLPTEREKLLMIANFLYIEVTWVMWCEVMCRDIMWCEEM